MHLYIYRHFNLGDIYFANFLLTLKTTKVEFKFMQPALSYHPWYIIIFALYGDFY